MSRELTWKDGIERGSELFETDDGYSGGYRKLTGVSLDGYFAGVISRGWSYSGRFATSGAAKAWCRQTVIRDRKAPLRRQETADDA